jgi:hypothetical protein
MAIDNIDEYAAMIAHLGTKEWFATHILVVGLLADAYP